MDIAIVPPGLSAKVQINFYQNTEDAVLKVFGVE